MPRWTLEARRKQAEIAKVRQPWKKSTGPKTAAGKNRSKWNAYKHGFESALSHDLRALLFRHRLYLRDCLLQTRSSLRGAAGDAAIQPMILPASLQDGLLRYARNDGKELYNTENRAFSNGVVKEFFAEARREERGGQIVHKRRSNAAHHEKGEDYKLNFNQYRPTITAGHHSGHSKNTLKTTGIPMTENITTDKTFTLTNDATGESIKLPVLHGTDGPDVLDIRKMYAENGHFTFDPSYTSTASCKSRITFIDGDKGVLHHRGYDIKELAAKSTYMEVCYLLLNGDLPNEKELADFSHSITMHTMVHDQMNYFYRGFRRDAHPMAVMCGVVGAMAAFYHDSLDIYDPKQREISAHRLIAKLPTLAAMTYKYSIGQPFMYPRNDLSYAENFLYQCFAVPAEPYKVSPVLAKAMDRILILHADHEQNASTSTVRLAGSSQANPFACIAAGIACLWGPAHGGANQEVLEMLDEIGDASRIPEFIAKAKDKNDPFRLMGFGHRVYKNMDPRAAVMRESCYEVLEELGLHDDPKLKLAMELEKAALADPYFAERKLFPNVDFYSGIILKAMGFPTEMFTVLFAVSRTVGWISQWKEMIEEPELRIGRPRQLYTGPDIRPYVDIKDRK